MHRKLVKEETGWGRERALGAPRGASSLARSLARSEKGSWRRTSVRDL